MIKSGTNQFRGNAFEFYRNSDFDANTWENNRSRAPKQERKQHIYGGTLGGPLVKNKLFFFGDYQGSRQDAPGVRHRVGGAGGLARAAICRAWQRTIRDPLTGQPFPGNQIPLEPNRRDRARAAERHRQLSAAEPRPCPAASPATTSATRCSRFAPIRATCASTGARRPTTSSSAATRSRPTKTGATSQPFPLVFAARNDQPFHNVAFNWNRIFGPTMINEVLVGYSNMTVTQETFDWAGIGAGNALLRHRRRPADRRPQLASAGPAA